MSINDEAQRDQRELVRGHLVRLTDRQGCVQWVNAFLVRRISVVVTNNEGSATAVELLSSDGVILVPESPDQIAGRLMQARIYTSDLAASLGGPLSMLAASLFSRTSAPKPEAASESKLGTRNATPERRRRSAMKGGPHGP